MLGGADKSNGDLGSYITGADKGKPDHHPVTDALG